MHNLRRAIVLTAQAQPRDLAVAALCRDCRVLLRNGTWRVDGNGLRFSLDDPAGRARATGHPSNRSDGCSPGVRAKRPMLKRQVRPGIDAGMALDKKPAGFCLQVARRRWWARGKGTNIAPTANLNVIGMRLVSFGNLLGVQERFSALPNSRPGALIERQDRPRMTGLGRRSRSRKPLTQITSPDAETQPTPGV